MQSVLLSVEISVLTLEYTWRTEPKRTLTHVQQKSAGKSTNQSATKPLTPELPFLLGLVHFYQRCTLIFHREREKKTTDANTGFCLTSGSCQNSICIHASHQTKAGKKCNATTSVCVWVPKKATTLELEAVLPGL